MTRHSLGVALAVGALAATALPRAASADLTGGGTLNFELRIPDKDGKFAVPSDDITKQYYFNRAHCECSLAGLGSEQDFGLFVKITDTPTESSALHVKGQFWSGPACDTTANTPTTTQCQQDLKTVVGDYYTELYSMHGGLYTLPLIELMAPVPATSTTPATCKDADAATGNIWLMVPDTSGMLQKAGSTTVNFDTKAPDLPTNLAVIGGEKSLHVTFTPPTSNNDLYYYQVLCARADTGAWPATPVGARYKRAAQLCGASVQDIKLTPFTIPNSDGKADVGLATLEEKYVCAEDTSTSTNITVGGLTNGVPYNLILLAIDKWGNAAGIQVMGSVTPAPVTDFWEDTHDQGSQIESGFCLISDTYGDGGPITDAMRGFRDDTLGSSSLGRAFTRFYYAHVAWLGQYARAFLPVRIATALLLLPLIALALAWHLLTLPGLLAMIAVAVWLRRRRRTTRRGRTRTTAAALPAVIVVAMIAAGGVAHAQDDTYFGGDEDADADADIGLPDANWVVGVKMGPYVPGIDAQFHAQVPDSTVRPYHQMFGGYNLMPMLDVDRVVWRGVGEITVGGTIGFLSKSANAFKDGTSPTDPDRDYKRSPGDTNAFRMIPMALLAGYRFTYLDDQWGIPIIPYVRGGLAYYAWWASGPDGNFSSIGNDNCHSPAPVPAMCTRQRAVGASMGLQGSVGIAIRGERIDPDSASSMRQSGLAHAGFYAELQGGWVDSFGDPHRFSLGDLTWMAGVDFEF